MRRNYISPEYKNKKVYGTFNMVEESNFFGAKMLEIEDSINIDIQTIEYYQRRSGEQIDLSIESTLPSIVYSSVDDKLANHTLIKDPSQNDFQLNNNTIWNLDINLKSILTNFLFATMKRYRTFESVQNYMTLENNVNVALTKYIEYNVLNRYKLSRLDFYVLNRDLRQQNVLRYQNNWKSSVINQSNLTKKYQTETAFDGSSIKITYSQEKNSQQFAFDYFFNLIFEKL